MKCPKCDEKMRKVRWVLTSNHKTGTELVEYDYTTYHCSQDDIWINTEIPLAENYKQKLKV